MIRMKAINIMALVFVSMALIPALAMADCSADGYNYKVPVTINMSQTNIDFQYNFSMANQTYQNDWLIKIYNGSETVALPFWISSSSTTQANITVRGNFTTANGTQLWICYNKTSAPNLSNCSNTMAFCDDFPGTGAMNATTWSGYATTPGTMKNQTVNGILIINGTNTGYETTQFFHQLSGLGSNYTVVARMQATPAVSNYGRISPLGITNTTDPFDSSKNALYFDMENTSFAAIQNYNVQVFTSAADGGRQLGTGSPSTEWQTYTVRRDGTLFNFTLETTNLGTQTHAKIDTNPYISILVNLWDQAKVYRALNIDYVYVKVNMNGTTTATFGASMPAVSLTVNITSPTNTSYILDYHNATIPVNFSAIGNTTSYECFYYLDGVLKGGNNATNNTVYSFPVNFTPGSHQVNVSCNNTFWKTNSSVGLSVLYDSEFNLTSSSGWNLIRGQSTTIGCSALAPSTIKIGTSLQTNPVSILPANGIYSVNCSITNTSFYPLSTTNTLVVTNQTTCYNQSTYAFMVNITPPAAKFSINMSDYVASGQVKASLNDTFIDGLASANMTKNLTNGYLINVDSTGLSTLIFRFGNYAINNNISLGAPQTVIYNITSYTQPYPFITISSFDEFSLSPEYPIGANISYLVRCGNGENFIEVAPNDTMILLPGVAYYDKITMFVRYSSTSYYYRMRYLTENNSITNVVMFFADAYQNALDKIDFNMLDSSYYGSLLQSYININGTEQIISECVFDTSHFCSQYLVEGRDYYLRALLGNSNSTYGVLSVSDPGTKTLSNILLTLKSGTNTIGSNVTAYAFANSNFTSMDILYNDATNTTYFLNVTYWAINGTLLNSSTFVTNSAHLTYNITDLNQTIKVRFQFNNSLTGGEIKTYETYVNKPSSPFIFVPAWLSNLVSIFIILAVGLTTTRENMIVGSIMTFSVAVLMVAIGWFVIDPLSLIFIAFVFLIAGATYYKDRGEMS